MANEQKNFKVGDRVRIVNTDLRDEDAGYRVGMIVTVTRSDDGRYFSVSRPGLPDGCFRARELIAAPTHAPTHAPTPAPAPAEDPALVWVKARLEQAHRRGDYGNPSAALLRAMLTDVWNIETSIAPAHVTYTSKDTV